MQATGRSRSAVTTILLRPMRRSNLIDKLHSDIAWTFQREPRCASSQASHVKCHWCPMLASAWFMDSTRRSWARYRLRMSDRFSVAEVIENALQNDSCRLRPDVWPNSWGQATPGRHRHHHRGGKRLYRLR